MEHELQKNMKIFFLPVQVQARHAQSPLPLLSSRFKYLIFFFVTTEYNNCSPPCQRVEEKIRTRMRKLILMLLHSLPQAVCIAG